MKDWMNKRDYSLWVVLAIDAMLWWLVVVAISVATGLTVDLVWG